MPVPSRFDDAVDRNIFRSPAKCFLSKRTISDEARWIAGATISKNGWDRMSGNFSAGFDHLKNTMSDACAQVHLQNTSGFELL